jgi:thioredoxin reductase (NADPH)
MSDAFTQAYIAAALWSTTDPDTEDSSLDQKYGAQDFAPATLEAIERDCAAFQKDNAKLLAKAHKDSGLTVGRSGFCFFMSRSGSGTGFFDEGLGAPGDKLQKAAVAFGEFEIYPGDDGKLYAVGHEERANEASAPGAIVEDFNTPEDALHHAAHNGFTHFTKIGRKVMVYGPTAEGRTLSARMYRHKGKVHFTEPVISKKAMPKRAKPIEHGHERDEHGHEHHEHGAPPPDHKVVSDGRYRDVAYKVFQDFDNKDGSYSLVIEGGPHNGGEGWHQDGFKTVEDAVAAACDTIDSNPAHYGATDDDAATIRTRHASAPVRKAQDCMPNADTLIRQAATKVRYEESEVVIIAWLTSEGGCDQEQALLIYRAAQILAIDPNWGDDSGAAQAPRPGDRRGGRGHGRGIYGREGADPALAHEVDEVGAPLKFPKRREDDLVKNPAMLPKSLASLYMREMKKIGMGTVVEVVDSHTTTPRGWDYGNITDLKVTTPTGEVVAVDFQVRTAAANAQSGPESSGIASLSGKSNLGHVISTQRDPDPLVVAQRLASDVVDQYRVRGSAGAPRSRARAPVAQERGLVWLERPDGVHWANATGGTFWLMPQPSGDYALTWMETGGNQKDLGTFPYATAVQMAGHYNPVTGQSDKPEYRQEPFDNTRSRQEHRSAHAAGGMGGDRHGMTLAQAKAILTPIGIVLSKTDGEYRVNFRGGGESTAYYTNDIEDAVATGKSMAKEGQHRNRRGQFMEPARAGRHRGEGGPRKIVTTFSRTTPAGEDEYPDEEHGWIDEEGTDMEPDEHDKSDGLTAVSKAVRFLKNEGAIEASSSHFNPGVWYSTEYQTIDYGTGTDEQRSFHLKGFTIEEEKEIWNDMSNRTRGAVANAPRRRTRSVGVPHNRELPDDLKPVLGTLSHNRDFTIQDLREYTQHDRPHIASHAKSLVEKLVRMGYLKQTPSRGHYYPTTAGWAWIEGSGVEAPHGPPFAHAPGEVQDDAFTYDVGDRVEVNLNSVGPAHWVPAEVVTVEDGRVWVKLPSGHESDLYSGSRIRRVSFHLAEAPAGGGGIAEAGRQLPKLEYALLIGPAHAKDTLRLRQFLSRNGHPFQFFDTEEDEGDSLIRQFGLNIDDLPAIVWKGRKYYKPANREVADILGFGTQVEGAHAYDVLIVGAGPAGLSCAVYAASEGLSCLAIEAYAPGGQAANSSRIENYAGFPRGISGADLAAQTYQQAQKFGARFIVPSSADRLIKHGVGDFEIRLSDRSSVHGKSVVLACGAEWRKPNYADLPKFEGAGVYYAATATEGSYVKGQDVVVVGGGNSAGQAAIFMSDLAHKVFLIVRGKGLSDTMSDYLIKRITKIKNIELLAHTEIVSLQGVAHLERVTWKTNGVERTEAVRHLFLMIGTIPKTDWLHPEGKNECAPKSGWLGNCVTLDEGGFVKTGADLTASEWNHPRKPMAFETSMPGTFAVGDVRSGSVKRVATAVGDGAVVITSVHKVLLESANVKAAE